MPSLEERIYLVKEELEKAGFNVTADSKTLNVSLNRKLYKHEVDALDLPIQTIQSGSEVVVVL